MSECRDAGERFVSELKPSWRDLKNDVERVGSAVAAASKAGELDQLLAQRVWADSEFALSLPMQRRYIAEGAFDPILAFHRKRAAFQTAGWPDELAREALQALVEHGRASDAVGLARDHVDHRLKRLRKDIQLRYRRGPRRPLDEQTKAAIESLSQAIVDDIPGRKAELIRDIERLESLFRNSGTADDGAWIDAMRAEIWKERRA